MRKGKYVIYGIIILAICIPASIVMLVYAFKAAGRGLMYIPNLAEFLGFGIGAIVAGLGGGALGIMQMKAPADPKTVKLENPVDDYEDDCYAIASIIRKGGKLDDAKCDFLKENEEKYRLSASALIYQFKLNGKKERRRFDYKGFCYLINKNQAFLIPSSCALVDKQKSEYTKIWEGYPDSSSRKFTLQNFTFLKNNEKWVSIFYQDYLDDDYDCDAVFNNIPNNIKEKAVGKEVEEVIRLIKPYVRTY